MLLGASRGSLRPLAAMKQIEEQSREAERAMAAEMGIRHVSQPLQRFSQLIVWVTAVGVFLFSLYKFFL